MVLLDLSNTMSDNIDGKNSVNRWELTLKMIRALLQTMGEEDTVQIVTFNNTVSLMLGEGMQKANTTTIKELNGRLDDTTPTWDKAVDIGEAIETAFILLRGSATEQKCENVSAIETLVLSLLMGLMCSTLCSSLIVETAQLLP